MLREYNKVKKEIKSLKMLWDRLYKNNETYSISWKKNTANGNLSVSRIIQNRLMLVSNCLFVVRKNQASLKIKNWI